MPVDINLLDGGGVLLWAEADINIGTHYFDRGSAQA
jgi:hypothetical protein